MVRLFRNGLVLLLLTGSIAGCAIDRSAFDLNRFRDPRAVDIESRMSGAPANFKPSDIK